MHKILAIDMKHVDPTLNFKKYLDFQTLQKNRIISSVPIQNPFQNIHSITFQKHYNAVGVLTQKKVAKESSNEKYKRMN